jgi:hypothetical protein
MIARKPSSTSIEDPGKAEQLVTKHVRTGIGRRHLAFRILSETWNDGVVRRSDPGTRSRGVKKSPRSLLGVGFDFRKILFTT